jgi:hypothetical protein
MSFAIGAPNYGGGKRNNFKIKDGSNIYRILPPCGSLAEAGKWTVYEAIHWGYKGTNNRFRNFRCPLQKGKDKMVVKPCAECDKIAEQKATYDRLFKELTEGKGMGKEAAKEKLKYLGDWTQSHNRDAKWYMNVMNPQGEIGRLPIPHKMYEALKLAIAEVIKKQIDPIAIDQGVYFDFQRSGTFSQTTHAVRIVTESFTPPGTTDTYERIKKAPLTQEQLKRMETEAYDLGDMFRSLTSDQVAMLVKSGGEADVVDAVFASPESKKDVATLGLGQAVESSASDEPSEADLATGGTLTPAPAPAAAAPAANDEIQALLARVAALQAAGAVSAPAVVEKPVVTAPAVSNPKTMSNADFMAAFGAGKI